MNHILAKESLIPLRTKLEILEELFPAAEAGNTEAHLKLFQIHKQYIAISPADMHWDCSGCRITAWNQIRAIVNHWNSQIE